VTKSLSIGGRLQEAPDFESRASASFATPAESYRGLTGTLYASRVLSSLLKTKHP